MQEIESRSAVIAGTKIIWGFWVGYKIKNGRITSMLRDIVLSGNVFQTLKNIKMIGDDKRMYGGLGGCGKGGQGPLPVSFGGPHMLIGDVLIGGKQR